MIDLCTALNNHFSKLEDKSLSIEAKDAEYSEIEKLISTSSKDTLKTSLYGLNNITDVLLRDMVAESINVVKHSLSVMSDLLEVKSEVKSEVFKNKQEVLRQLILIIQKNASLSHNMDITCKALQCIRYLCTTETSFGNDARIIKSIVIQGLVSTQKTEDPLKLQSLFILMSLLQVKLIDFSENTNNWVKILIHCIFDDNASIREVALAAFNMLKPCLTGKEDHLDHLATNLIPLKYAKILVEMVSRDKDWPAIWRLLVELMGKRLHSSSVLVNSLLAVEEKAFKTSNTETKKEAFNCWKSLVRNFALEHSVLASERRVKLITIPLRANNCRNVEIAQVKLEVWWYIVRLLRSDVSRFLDTMLHPFLNFCFGPLGDTCLVSSNGQNRLNGTNSGESLGRLYPVIRVPCLHALSELLAKSAGRPTPPAIAKDLAVMPLLAPPIVHHKDFCQSSRLFTQCMGEAVLLVGHDLEQLPWIVHGWKSLLMLVIQATVDTTNLNLNDPNCKDLKNSTMVKDILRLLGNLVETSASMPEAKSMGHVILSMIESLVIGDTAFQASILNSHAYAVGSFQVMNGTPSLVLAVLLLSPVILNDKTSHARYMDVFSKVLSLGLDGVVPQLPFTRALLKKLEANVSSEQPSSDLMPYLQELWILIVNHLSDAINKDGSISEGNDAAHDFHCIYGLLMFPISHFLKNESSKESIDPLVKPWKRLFELFFINAQLVITTQSSEVIEELCRKILLVVKKTNASSNYIANLMQFVVIIYGVNFYESYWKVSKGPKAGVVCSPKGDKLKVFHNSQQLLIVLFYKLSDLMPLYNASNENMTKHCNIISFLVLIFTTATSYNFLNFLVDKVLICVGYYLKLTAGNSKYQLYLENEVVKLWEKFLEYVEKKIFVTKGKTQTYIDTVSPLFEDGFNHPLTKIVELTKSYWNRSIGQVCMKVEIPKSLSDILDDALKDTSNSEDMLAKMVDLEKAVSSKAPNHDKKQCQNKKSIPKVKLDAHQSIPTLETSVEFKIIPPKPKAPVLTEHQKEMMKARRLDIPAMYQDLTQDSASQSYSQETDMTPPILKSIASCLAIDITEDANPPFLMKENSDISEKVIDATNSNVPSTKESELIGKCKMGLLTGIVDVTSKSDKGKGSDDVEKPNQPSSNLPLVSHQQVLKKRGRKPRQTVKSPAFSAAKASSSNMSPPRRDNVKLNKEKPRQTEKSQAISAANASYSNMSTPRRDDVKLNKEKSVGNACSKSVVSTEATKYFAVMHGDVVVMSRALPSVKAGNSPLNANETNTIKSSTENMSQRSEESNNVVEVLSSALSNQMPMKSTRKKSSLVTTSAGIQKSTSNDEVSSSSANPTSVPQESTTDVEISSASTDPTSVQQKSTVEAASITPTPVLQKSTSNSEASSISINPTSVPQESATDVETSSASTDPTSVSQKSTTEAACTSINPTPVPQESAIDAEDSSASVNLTPVLQKSTNDAEATSASSFPKLSSKRVLRKSVTRLESSLCQVKKLKTQDSSKENEMPLVSPKENKMSPVPSEGIIGSCKRRGRPRKWTNLGDTDLGSPSTSKGFGRTRRQRANVALDSSSSNASKSSTDVVNEKETESNKELTINIVCDQSPGSSKNAECDENLSPSLVNQEDKSKSEFLDESRDIKKKDNAGNKKSSNTKEMQNSNILLVKVEASRVPQINCYVQGEESNEIDKSPALSKSNLTVDSPKSKPFSGSHKSKLANNSPSLDKWVIVKKRVTTEKTQKNESNESAKSEIISVNANAEGVSDLVECGSSTENDLVECGSSTENNFSSNSEDLIDSSQDPLDSSITSNSSLKSMTKKCVVHLSRMTEIFSNEVAFIPFEGKILRCNLSPSKKEEPKNDSEVKKSTLLNGTSVVSNLFLSPRSNTGRGARILNMAQGNKEKHSFDENLESPLKEVESKKAPPNCNNNLEGSPSSHLKSPEFGCSTPPMKKPRRIRPMQIGNVSPQYRSLEIGCVASEGDITIHSYSPNASPRGSLMKKKRSIQESGEDSISPSSKKARRVSFADPIVSQHVEFCIPESERKFKKRMVNRCLKLPYGPSDEVVPIESLICHSESNMEESSASKADDIEAIPQNEIISNSLSSEKPKEVSSENILKTSLCSSEINEQKLDENVDQIQDLARDLGNCSTTVLADNRNISTSLSVVECKKSENEKQHSESSSISCMNSSVGNVEGTPSHEMVLMTAAQDEQKEVESCRKDLCTPILSPMEVDPPQAQKKLQENKLPLNDSQKALKSPEIIDSDLLENEPCSQELRYEPRTHKLNSQEEACPSLRDCEDPATEIIDILTSRYWTGKCRLILEEKNIITIGDLSRLTEEDVEDLPFRVNKWKKLKATLHAYKPLLSKREASESTSSIEVDITQTDTEEISDELKGKIFREMLSKLSAQEVAKELHSINLADDVHQEIESSMPGTSFSKSSSDGKLKGCDTLSQDKQVKSLESSKSITAEVSDSESCSRLKSLDMLHSLSNRSDLKDAVDELSLEKLMQFLKYFITSAHKKVPLFDGSVDIAARRILQCVHSELMHESGSTDIIKQFLWVFQNTLFSKEHMKGIPSLLNCVDGCVVSELILKQENIMKNILNQISPSKVLMIAVDSLSGSNVSTLPSDQVNQLNDILDEGRTIEELVDRFSLKIKQRTSETHLNH